MKIAVIDADLIGRKNHRFPNLACMKISGFHKSVGDDVVLRTDYSELSSFDCVYISKVFTDTPIPVEVLEFSNVRYGGTGFYYDKAPDLPCEIEHAFPDYHLYDDFIFEQTVLLGKKPSEFKEYTDYSIGFITRGCFRKCGFCVNQKYDHVFQASPLKEFYDPSRPKICLLDDNFFGYPKWKDALQELIGTGKKFKFKQGLDERILTQEKAEMLFSAKYDGEVTFAFDNVEDYDLIKKKLELIRSVTQKQVRFYVLCGYDKDNKYDEEFFVKDIFGIFTRLALLGCYGCSPYIMRFNRYEGSRWRQLYVTIARWVNQTSYFKKQSLREYAFITDYNSGGRASQRIITQFEYEYPELAKVLFDTKYYTYERKKK